LPREHDGLHSRLSLAVIIWAIPRRGGHHVDGTVSTPSGLQVGPGSSCQKRRSRVSQSYYSRFQVGRPRQLGWPLFPPGNVPKLVAVRVSPRKTESSEYTDKIKMMLPTTTRRFFISFPPFYELQDWSSFLKFPLSVIWK